MHLNNYSSAITNNNPINSGLPSPRSSLSSNVSDLTGIKLVDPDLVRSSLELRGNMLITPQPLHKRTFISAQNTIIESELELALPENPPPCNEYYLMNCFKGVRLHIIRSLSSSFLLPFFVEYLQILPRI